LVERGGARIREVALCRASDSGGRECTVEMGVPQFSAGSCDFRTRKGRVTKLMAPPRVVFLLSFFSNAPLDFPLKSFIIRFKKAI
jgi:hypothetical protein